MQWNWTHECEMSFCERIAQEGGDDALQGVRENEAEMMTKTATCVEFVHCSPKVVAEVPATPLVKNKKQGVC